MASLRRSLCSLLNRPTTTATATATRRTPHRTPLSISIRTAQTQATQPAINTTAQPPPPPTFQQHPQQTTPTPRPEREEDDILKNHPILQSLRQNPSLKETRPHLSMPSTLRPSHLIGGSLSGPSKLPVAPYIFISKPEPNRSQQQQQQQPRKSHATAIFHIGTHLCGHPGFVHGGLLSIMFDEVFAHCVSQSFRSGTGMTANLNVDFRKPALPGRVYVLRAETVEVEGRKAWVEGSLTMTPPCGEEGAAEKKQRQQQQQQQQESIMVAEARALFVEPRFAESMVPVYRN